MHTFHFLCQRHLFLLLSHARVALTPLGQVLLLIISFRLVLYKRITRFEDCEFQDVTE